MLVREEWKQILTGEIRERDIFWLFWSRSAMDSPWVGWEWRTALASKSLMGIQPHPLEPAELAPPPQELSDLQFGAVYEWHLSGLRESWLTRRCRTLWRRAMSVLHSRVNGAASVGSLAGRFRSVNGRRRRALCMRTCLARNRGRVVRTGSI